MSFGDEEVVESSPGADDEGDGAIDDEDEPACGLEKDSHSSETAGLALA